MRPRTNSLDGDCVIKRYVEVTMYIPGGDEAGYFKMWVKTFDIGECIERGMGWNSMNCDNAPSDEYITYTDTSTEICNSCDPTCPPNKLFNSFTSFRKETDGGLPPELQRLRNLLNNTCYDNDLPDDYRRKVGPNTIGEETLRDLVRTELENLFPELKDIRMDCGELAREGICNCGDVDIIAAKYSNIN